MIYTLYLRIYTAYWYLGDVDCFLQLYFDETGILKLLMLTWNCASSTIGLMPAMISLSHLNEPML